MSCKCSSCQGLVPQTIIPDYNPVITVDCIKVRECLSVKDTNTVDMNFNLSNGSLSADVKVSVGAGNILVANGDGLFVPPGATYSVSDTNSIDLTLTGTTISADSKISADAGNTISVHADGLFVPTPSSGGQSAQVTFFANGTGGAGTDADTPMAIGTSQGSSVLGFTAPFNGTIDYGFMTLRALSAGNSVTVNLKKNGVIVAACVGGADNKNVAFSGLGIAVNAGDIISGSMTIPGGSWTDCFFGWIIQKT